MNHRNDRTGSNDSLFEWPEHFPGRGTPFTGGRRIPSGDKYAMWDAAYVLGSLSARERREFEAHLVGCPSCWQAVTELSGVAPLLALLDCDEVAAINELESIGSFADAPGSFNSPKT